MLHLFLCRWDDAFGPEGSHTQRAERRPTDPHRNGDASPIVRAADHLLVRSGIGTHVVHDDRMITLQDLQEERIGAHGEARGLLPHQLGCSSGHGKDATPLPLGRVLDYRQPGGPVARGASHRPLGCIEDVGERRRALKSSREVEQCPEVDGHVVIIRPSPICFNPPNTGSAHWP